MTLILTLVATNIIQVSDRRLTLNGEVCGSNANKLVCGATTPISPSARREWPR